MTFNDPALSRRVLAAVAKVVGQGTFGEWHPEMVAEDFGELCNAAGSPAGRKFKLRILVR